MRYTKNSKMSDAQATAFGVNMKTLRKAEGLTAVQLGELLGVSYTHVSNLEKAVRKPSPELAKAIAEVFDTTVDEMQKSSADKWNEEKKAYAKTLIRRREDKNYDVATMSKLLGVKFNRYLEYERGETMPAQSEKERIDMILGKPKEKVEKPTEPVKKECAEIPYEIVDVILKHVRDLNVSTDIQKTVYRYFSKVKMENEERRLFG